jgi:phage/plasmid-associated DNA primase
VRLARRGESSAGIAGALTLASTESEVAVTPDDLDADPFLLNCANGTLDLRTGELREHNPVDLLTKITRAAYRPDAEGPEFARFLRRIQPEQAMRDFLARLLGHALEGRVVSHILPIFYGEGANGKGTLIGNTVWALGDYADAADPDLITARSFDAHPTGVADLYRLRLAVLHESDNGWRPAEGPAHARRLLVATNAYRAESDALGRFIDQQCSTGTSYHVGSSDLFAAWSKWSANEGEQPGTQTAFATRMQNKGFDKKPTMRGKVWLGVGLLAEEE